MSLTPNCSLVTRELPHDREAERFAATEALTDHVLGVQSQDDEVSIALVRNFCARVVKCAEVFSRKQSDYGPENIAAFGEMGLLVRINDKVSRLKNLVGKPARNEALDDTWLDIGVYGFIAGMVRDGTWPGCQDKHRLDFSDESPETMSEIVNEMAADRDDAYKAIILLGIERYPVSWRLALGIPGREDEGVKKPQGLGEFINEEALEFPDDERVSALQAIINAVKSRTF